MAKFTMNGELEEEEEDEDYESRPILSRFKRQRPVSPGSSPEPYLTWQHPLYDSDELQHIVSDAERNVTAHDDDQEEEEEDEELEAEEDEPPVEYEEEEEDLPPTHVQNQTVAPSSLASGSTAVNGVASQGARDSAGTSRDGPIKVTLVDPDVLDCSICFNPLCAPVYQCENGHIACSACCTKIQNKCPSCSWPIGYNRCRAIEKVLESVKISCINIKYGCNEALSYSKRSEHEKICLHAPCSCLCEDCSFLGSSKQLSAHLKSTHVVASTSFQYSSPFKIVINDTDKFLTLEEKVEGTLFIISNVVKTLGNIVAVSCIGPSSNERFRYDMTVTSEGSTLKLDSLTKISQGGQDQNYEKGGFLLIPYDFFGSDRHATLYMCIWRHGRARNALSFRKVVF